MDKLNSHIKENIHSIEFVFENLESIIVPLDKIISIKTEDLIKVDGEIFGDSAFRTNYFECHIKYEDESELEYSNNDYPDALGMYIGNPTSNRVKDRPNILGRLIEHNDLCCVELLEKDETIDRSIYIPWGEEDYSNNLLHVYPGSGILTIVAKEHESYRGIDYTQTENNEG